MVKFMCSLRGCWLWEKLTIALSFILFSLLLYSSYVKLFHKLMQWPNRSALWIFHKKLLSVLYKINFLKNDGGDASLLGWSKSVRWPEGWMGFDLALLSAWVCVVKDHRGSCTRTYMPVNKRNEYDTLTHRVRSISMIAVFAENYWCACGEKSW